jgi:hypothetical protein
MEESNTQSYELLYSPRTTYSKLLDKEEILYKELTLNFDPITIKIIKKHFKEHLGSLNKTEFISILKNHLLSWQPKVTDRQKILVKLLDRLFSEIDLNDNESMEWAEFTNYIIHNSNSLDSAEGNSTVLRVYAKSKSKIMLEKKANKSYAFIIEKFNLLGLVEDDNCRMEFYDATTFTHLKDKTIDLSTIQNKIDELQNRMIEQKIESEKKKKKNVDVKVVVDDKKEDSDEDKKTKKRKCHKIYSVNKKLTIVATSIL